MRRGSAGSAGRSGGSAGEGVEGELWRAESSEGGAAELGRHGGYSAAAPPRRRHVGPGIGRDVRVLVARGGRGGLGAGARQRPGPTPDGCGRAWDIASHVIGCRYTQETRVQTSMCGG